MKTSDLKPNPDIHGTQPITGDRAFTISQLVVLRVRDEHGHTSRERVHTDRERELLTRVAGLIADVARAWE